MAVRDAKVSAQWKMERTEAAFDIFVDCHYRTPSANLLPRQGEAVECSRL